MSLHRRPSIVLALVLASCASSAPRVERPPPAPPPPVEPAIEREVALEDDPTPEGPSCDRADACEAGQQCRGPAGCEAGWACGAPRECGEATVSYCGCDGLTFYAPENCPGRPYAQRGPCAALGEEVGEGEVDEVEGNAICTSDDDCRRGFVCAGVAGCGTFWTCVRRRSLRCTRDRAPFCSCEGETFFASSSCPGRPIAHAGYCPGDEPDAGLEPSEAAASSERAASDEGAGGPAASGRAHAATEPPAGGRASERAAERAAPDRTGARAATSEPGAATCTSSADCPHGQQCTGDAGCEGEWHCAPRRQRCLRDTQYFCGCDGQTFRASMTCPGRRYRHRGSCGPE